MNAYLRIKSRKTQKLLILWTKTRTKKMVYGMKDVSGRLSGMLLNSFFDSSLLIFCFVNLIVVPSFRYSSIQEKKAKTTAPSAASDEKRKPTSDQRDQNKRTREDVKSDDKSR